jgi:pantothenate kinase-related protein Tda10
MASTCFDGWRCGERPAVNSCDGYCPECPSWPEDESEWALLDQRLNGHRDVNAHYQRVYKGILLDPYRIALVWDMRGGPREQIMKKCLRFTEKGQTEQEVVNEIRSALNRWQAMLEEDLYD